jgi:hypothetical protein
VIELHERLSEFSYSYGVTREVERLLAGIGIRAVPFLPSLLHEANLGFDVGFNYNRPGAVLMLQFKLGQWLERFHRRNKLNAFPDLERPFWRFWINTAEPGGQYETLLIAEHSGAEVYYAAPRFRDWSQYLDAFETEQVLDRSLLITPSDIRHALDASKEPDGNHRIAYDSARVYVCSEPELIEETHSTTLGERVQRRTVIREQPLANTLRQIFSDLESRTLYRREIESARLPDHRTQPPLTEAQAFQSLRV